jgi:hypothetical protein
MYPITRIGKSSGFKTIVKSMHTEISESCCRLRTDCELN